MMKQSIAAQEKAAAIVSMIAETKSAEQVAAELGVTASEARDWRNQYLERMAKTLETPSKSPGNRFQRRSKIAAGAALLVATVLVAAPAVRSAVPEDCTDPAAGFLCIFEANTPAKANEINSNFQKLWDWLEGKVGPAESSDISTTGVAATGSISAGSATVHGALSAGSISTSTMTTNTVTASNTGISVAASGGVSGLGGCYTRWGATGCATGWDEVTRGHSGGLESFMYSGGSMYANVECVSDIPENEVSWANEDWGTRMFRAEAGNAPDGMDAVKNECSICCRGGCYTALGTTTCADGYSQVYDGRVGGVEAYNPEQIYGKTLCVDGDADPIYTWGSGYRMRLMRHRNANTDGSTGAMDQIPNTCAVCCK